MFADNIYKISDAGHNLTLWILILLSVLSIAYILERYFALKKYKQNSERVNLRIQEALQSNNLTEIEDISRDRETLEGRALSYGLRHAKDNGEAGLEEIFNSYSIVERPKLEKNLNFLASVGSNAPFIGLLGTVFGIMDAFRELASSQGGDANLVMLSISKALIATGVGLFVAIPAVVAYNYFQKQVKSVFQSLDSVREICIAIAKTNKKGNA